MQSTFERLPSRSKLSVHLLGGRYTEGARAIVAQRPRLLKLFDLGDDMRQALVDYKRSCPTGVVVLRLWTPVLYRLDQTPEECAADYWERWIWPPLANLSEKERRLIDYVEGPNEGDSTPTWETTESVRWFSRFWVALVERMRRQGIRPCVGSIPVGNPPGKPRELEARWLAFAPALESALRAGGAWSYHAYTIEYTEDPEKESWFSLRYRRLSEILRRRRPSLARLPIILSEGGVDSSGNPSTSGHLARGSVERYQSWLEWFDAQIQSDPNVLGATLFQIGDPQGWPSFDLEPIAPWIARHLARNASPRRSIP